MANRPVTSEDGVLKLVYLGGYVELYWVPVTAREVMEKNPDHSVTRPDFWKYPWIVIQPESILKPGRVFYIIPNHVILDLVKAYKLQNHFDSLKHRYLSSKDSLPVQSGAKLMSPIHRCKESSPVQSGAKLSSLIHRCKESSPVQSGVKLSSPIHRCKEASPVQSGAKLMSPIHRCKEASPVQSGAKLSSPIQRCKESSPLQSGAKLSPIYKSKESSPVQLGAKMSPMHRDHGYFETLLAKTELQVEMNVEQQPPIRHLLQKIRSWSKSKTVDTCQEREQFLIDYQYDSYCDMVSQNEMNDRCLKQSSPNSSEWVESWLELSANYQGQESLDDSWFEVRPPNEYGLVNGNCVDGTPTKHHPCSQDGQVQARKSCLRTQSARYDRKPSGRRVTFNLPGNEQKEKNFPNF